MHRRPERQNIEIVLYNNHLQRLRNMKATVDNSTPKTHPFNNRRQKEIARNNKRIDDENCLLLENIAKTIQKERKMAEDLIQNGETLLHSLANQFAK